MELVATAAAGVVEELQSAQLSYEDVLLEVVTAAAGVEDVEVQSPHVSLLVVEFVA